MYHSQFGQDKFINEYIFKGFRDGYFVDVGAHNGVSINNTLCFEKEYGWTGINIEPIPSVYNELKKNRSKCVNLNVAVDNRNGYTDFILNRGPTEMISGILNYYEPQHFVRLRNELDGNGGTSEIVSVPTRRLDDIFMEYEVKHIHLLSIDVEGAELVVLESINFDTVFIDVITIEDNYKTRRSLDFLNQKGY